MDDTSASTEVCGNCLELGKRNGQLTLRVAELSRRNRVLRRGRLRDQARIRKLNSKVAFLGAGTARGPRRGPGDGPKLLPAALGQSSGSAQAGGQEAHRTIHRGPEGAQGARAETAATGAGGPHR